MTIININDIYNDDIIDDDNDDDDDDDPIKESVIYLCDSGCQENITS